MPLCHINQSTNLPFHIGVILSGSDRKKTIKPTVACVECLTLSYCFKYTPLAIFQKQLYSCILLLICNKNSIFYNLQFEQ